MKKRIFIGIATIAVATITAVNVNIALQGSDLSALSLANVEALAGENNGNNSTSTWQVGEKTIVTTTSSGWTWDVSANAWLFNGKVTNTIPPNTTTVKIKCCRPQGDVTSCPYENC
jgi:hypothetical protein